MKIRNLVMALMVVSSSFTLLAYRNEGLGGAIVANIAADTIDDAIVGTANVADDAIYGGGYYDNRNRYRYHDGRGHYSHDSYYHNHGYNRGHDRGYSKHHRGDR